MGGDTTETRARFEVPLDSIVVSVSAVGQDGRLLCKLSLLQSRLSGRFEDGNRIFVAIDEHTRCCVQPKKI